MKTSVLFIFLFIQGFLTLGNSDSLTRFGHNSIRLNEHSVLFFGGIDTLTHQPQNSVLYYDHNLNRYGFKETTGDFPSPRSSSAIIQIDKDAAVLLGGTDGAEVFNDVFLYNNTLTTWFRAVQMTYINDLGRSNHAAAINDKGEIYMFGGMERSGRSQNSLVKISLTTNSFWNQGEGFFVLMEPLSFSANSSSSKTEVRADTPEPRSGHSMTFVKDSFLIFGGTSPSESLFSSCADLFKLDIRGDDLAVWERVVNSPPCPSPREGHAALRHGSSLLILGGCRPSISHTTCYNDIWQFDTKTSQWRNITAYFSTAFSPRMSHTAVFLDKNSILVSGGRDLNNENTLSDALLVWNVDCLSSCAATQGYCNKKNQCQCQKGFFGHDCGEISLTEMETPRTFCSDHGIPQANGRCDCYMNYYGSICEYGENKCLNNCSGKGHCNSKSQCKCDFGYSGIDCSISAHCPSSCCNRGTCNKFNQCVCHYPYFGSTCSVTMQQIFSMRESLKENRRQAHHLLDTINAKILTLEQGQPTTLTLAHSIDQKNLEEKLIFLKETLQEKVADMLSEASNDEIAVSKAMYFTESQCKSIPKDISIQNIMLEPLERSQSLKKISSRVFTGETSYDQNLLTIEQSRKEGRTEHIMPSAPGNIAMEDLFALAAKKEFAHNIEATNKTKSLVYSNLPNQHQTPFFESEFYLSPLRQASLFSHLCFAILFMVIGSTSTFAVYYTNLNMKVEPGPLYPAV